MLNGYLKFVFFGLSGDRPLEAETSACIPSEPGPDPAEGSFVMAPLPRTPGENESLANSFAVSYPRLLIKFAVATFSCGVFSNKNESIV